MSGSEDRGPKRFHDFVGSVRTKHDDTQATTVGDLAEQLLEHRILRNVSATRALFTAVKVNSAFSMLSRDANFPYLRLRRTLGSKRAVEHAVNLVRDGAPDHYIPHVVVISESKDSSNRGLTHLLIKMLPKNDVVDPVPELEQTQSLRLTSHSAISREALITVAELYGLTIRGYSDESKWVLASLDITESKGNVTLVQLTRSRRNKDTYDIYLKWLGNTPATRCQNERLENLIRSRYLNRRPMVRRSIVPSSSASDIAEAATTADFLED